MSFFIEALPSDENSRKRNKPNAIPCIVQEIEPKKFQEKCMVNEDEQITLFTGENPNSRHVGVKCGNKIKEEEPDKVQFQCYDALTFDSWLKNEEVVKKVAENTYRIQPELEIKFGSKDTVPHPFKLGTNNEFQLPADTAATIEKVREADGTGEAAIREQFAKQTRETTLTREEFYGSAAMLYKRWYERSSDADEKKSFENLREYFETFDSIPYYNSTDNPDSLSLESLELPTPRDLRDLRLNRRFRLPEEGLNDDNFKSTVKNWLDIHSRSAEAESNASSWLRDRPDDASHISNWNVSNIIDMSLAFEDAVHFNQPLKKWDTTNVTNMHGMFSNCKAFNQQFPNTFKTSNVTNMSFMFLECLAFNQKLPTNFDTSSVTDMNYMFEGCEQFNQALPEASFNTSLVTNMTCMFQGCERFNQKLPESFNTKNVKNMEFMFATCKNFNQKLPENFKTQNVENMGYMFLECEQFNQELPESFNTQNVTNMTSMFENCKNFNKKLPENFKTVKVEKMDNMFQNCSAYNQPFPQSFDMSNMGKMSNTIFKGCEKLHPKNMPKGMLLTNDINKSYDGKRYFLPESVSDQRAKEYFIRNDILKENNPNNLYYIKGNKNFGFYCGENVEDARLYFQSLGHKKEISVLSFSLRGLYLYSPRWQHLI